MNKSCRWQIDWLHREKLSNRVVLSAGIAWHSRISSLHSLPLPFSSPTYVWSNENGRENEELMRSMDSRKKHRNLAIIYSHDFSPISRPRNHSSRPSFANWFQLNTRLMRWFFYNQQDYTPSRSSHSTFSLNFHLYFSLYLLLFSLSLSLSLLILTLFVWIYKYYIII